MDWLLENLIQTKVCKLDQDHKKCKKEKEKLWLHYKPSLFQHIGTHSSLKGKVQKLKDRQFGRVQLFVPHKNPAATIDSPIKHYKHYSITRAYQGETFFWGLVPQVPRTPSHPADTCPAGRRQDHADLRPPGPAEQLPPGVRERGAPQ